MTIQPSLLSDTTMRTVQAALNGLSSRRQAIEDNIANVETPGFLANTVSFEDSLRSAMSGGDPTKMRIGTARSMAATNLNGNNVQIDQELVNLSDTELRNQLMVEAMNAKYRLLRTAIAGQG